MYINNEELTALETAVNKLQDIIETQNDGQNNYFIEGIFQAREDANQCEKYIKKVRDREVRKIAKQIVKKRTFNSKN